MDFVADGYGGIESGLHSTIRPWLAGA